MNLILVGAGGHVKSCIACIETTEHKIIGLLDIPEEIGNMIEGYPIIGSDEDIKEFNKSGTGFLVTLGQIESSELRKKLFARLLFLKANLPVIVSSTAFVAKTAAIDLGTIIMHKCMINSSATIGKNCIMNTGCIIEHDCLIDDTTHVSTGAIVNGSCHIGKGCFVGSGSVIKNNITICDDVVIGAGSVVVKDINVPGIYIGNPARRIK